MVPPYPEIILLNLWEHRRHQIEKRTNVAYFGGNQSDGSISLES